MDPIELEFLLRALASYTEAEARTLDTLNLPVSAENARTAAAKARAFTVPAEAPWGPATTIVADRCVECRQAEPEVIWNRAYAICRACAAKWEARRAASAKKG